MVKTCCVEGCVSADESTYFKFPNSRTQRRKWLDVIITSQKLTDNSVICRQHFHDDQYEVIRGKVRLKAKVIPSVFVKAKSKSPEISRKITKSPISNNNVTTDNTNDVITDTLATINNTLNNINHLLAIRQTTPEAERSKENDDTQDKSQECPTGTEFEANKDIEDIITNYHIKLVQPIERLHTPEKEKEHAVVDRVTQTETGDTDAGGVIEINDDGHNEPHFIEISADKGRSGDDCLMVLENVQVDVDPALMFPDLGEVNVDPESSDSDVVDLGEKKDDPISLLTSSDEDEVIIEEPEIDTVEVSDETDEDDVPLLKLVKRKKRFKVDKLSWGGYEYFCIQCRFTTGNHGDYQKHLNRHHPGQRRLTNRESTVLEVCHICDYTTSSRGQFIRHKRKHKTEKRYECRICEYKARHHMSLVFHMKTHNESCKKCGYTTNGVVNLVKHVKKCRAKPKYKCDQCYYSTLRRSDLKRHRLRVHQDGDDDRDVDYTPD